MCVICLRPPVSQHARRAAEPILRQHSLGADFPPPWSFKQDQVTFGSLTFSDGTTLPFGTLPNSGTGFSVTVGNLTTSYIVISITAVSSSTANVGLAEVVVLGTETGATAEQQAISGTSFAWAQDVALLATATASSSSPGQGPSKAIDGLLGGYKDDGTGDYTQEWASAGEGDGAWLQLTWPSDVLILGILAYDRPNAEVSRLGL